MAIQDNSPEQRADVPADSEPRQYAPEQPDVAPSGCLAMGLILAAVSGTVGMLTGQTEVWGDGLPWVMLFWLGLLFAFVSLLALLCRRRK